MNRPALSARGLIGVAAGLVAALATGPIGLKGSGYAPAPAGSHDTLRLRSAGPARVGRRSTLGLGTVILGYLSPRGLPPVQGRFTVTDTGLVFQSADGSTAMEWRPSTISLAYMDAQDGRPVYVFRVDAGVFETDVPGPLLDVSAHPNWLESPGSGEWPSEPLVNGRDSAAVRAVARDIAGSPYADSLYLLFGRPRAPIGLVGDRGRSAGRLGEYIASRDSLAIDPARMSAVTQLRHAMAHELGHRWQAREPAQVATLWRDVRPIRDPKRYGYGEVSEHQAEAIAFAITFLQTTAAADPNSAGAALTLLDHYELFVPGTRNMVRYLSLQPLYRNHPLRALLTTGRV